jgi:hypothetical protein
MLDEPVDDPNPKGNLPRIIYWMGIFDVLSLHVIYNQMANYFAEYTGYS